jgi:hypothetical protein
MACRICQQSPEHLRDERVSAFEATAAALATREGHETIIIALGSAIGKQTATGA